MPRNPGRRRALAIAVIVTSAALALTACSPPSKSSTTSSTTKTTLTVAAPGSSKDALDPNFSPGAEIDLIRSHQLFDNLTSFDAKNKLEYDLATSMTSNSAGDVWTIHLRKGVTFQDGSIFGAKDVAYTINRVIATDSTANAKSLLSFITSDGLKVVDPLTLQVTLKKPYGPFAELWANKYLPIVPTNFNAKAPVGTGPFKFVSFAAGQSSTFERFDDYWGDKAKSKTLKIVDFADDDAAINAVKSGQVDISSSVPLAEVSALKSSGVKILDSPSTSYINIAMNTSVAPYNDPKVREAMRLIVDRKQMVDTALNGYGVIGNDYIGGTTTNTPDVAQRSQNITEAKKLLKESGHANLLVTLTTTNGTPGMVESAQVFAQQAKKAGVTVKVDNLDVASYLNNYLKWPFAVDFFSDTYLQLASRTLLPGGSSNETHWNNAQFESLATQAFEETNDAKRAAIEKKMKIVEYNEGGNIIWGYYDVVNAYSSKVHGLKKDVTGNAVERLAAVSVDQ